jgi:hypothetical protein
MMLQRFVWYERRPIAQLQIRFMWRKKSGSLWNRWRGEARQVALMQPGLPSLKANLNQFVLHKFKPERPVRVRFPPTPRSAP